MALCDVCGNDKGARTISGISFCEECFGKLQKVRKGDEETINFFLDKNNLSAATPKAVEYLTERAEENKAKKESGGFENQEVTQEKPPVFDYELHGTNPLYELKGNRGRRMYVYPHKCVLVVDVTLGSIITQNATDGEKTIYYKDVIGVQMKKAGWTIGYLQLETASEKGNNASSNFFDENTFTFDHYSDVYQAYKYILSRLDEIKKID